MLGNSGDDLLIYCWQRKNGNPEQATYFVCLKKQYVGNMSTVTRVVAPKFPYRLVSLAAPGGKNWGFTYDPVGRLLTQTLPNGLSTQHGYDTVGRPASLQHKDGSTVVEGWNYSYDKNDNLRTIASARTGDAGAWTYLYDGRNRLREAFRKNSAGALVSRHGFEYDAGDNLSSKTVTPYTQQFFDAFSDGNINANPAWLSTGVWSATTQEAVNTANPSINPEISQNIANSDGEYWYSYKIEDVSVSGARTRLLLRRTNATNDCIRILFNANSFNIKQQSGGVTTDLLTNSSIVTASDTWYDVYARAAGGTIEVWRGLRGEKLSLVGKVTNATVLSGEAVAFDTACNTVAHFDDLRMCTARTANQSFTSTFTGAFDGWVAETGTWSAANNYLTNTSTGVQAAMRKDTASTDFQMKFSYRDTSGTPGPWAQARFRYADGNNFAFLTLYPTSFGLSEKRSGTVVGLTSGSWTTTSGTWYDVTVIAEGSHIEVWRGPKDGAQSRVCSVDTATVMSGVKSYLVAAVNGTYAFDDVQVTAEDLSTTTYTYDTANQLTAMNVNGTTTNFSYDDWGRMAGKTQGSYAATYDYRFGDKLKAVTSSFPGEAPSVGYNYDGLGKRRVEQLGTSSITWFRWLGMEESGEYTGTPGSWTIGAMQTGYVPGLATFAGSNPVTAEWRYPLTDHLGSVRQLSAQNKAALAHYDYAPYGELMRSAGLPLTVGYTGHRWDPAIGQYFAPFRYYNPQTARWNMRDPLGLIAGVNQYAYVSGNPALKIDPLGLCGLGFGIGFVGFMVMTIGPLVVDKLPAAIAISGPAAFLIGVGIIGVGLLVYFSDVYSGGQSVERVGNTAEDNGRLNNGLDGSVDAFLNEQDQQNRQALQQIKPSPPPQQNPNPQNCPNTTGTSGNQGPSIRRIEQPLENDGRRY